jgi:hypothetical protein
LQPKIEKGTGSKYGKGKKPKVPKFGRPASLGFVGGGESAGRGETGKPSSSLREIGWMTEATRIAEEKGKTRTTVIK